MGSGIGRIAIALQEVGAAPRAALRSRQLSEVRFSALEVALAEAPVGVLDLTIEGGWVEVIRGGFNLSAELGREPTGENQLDVANVLVLQRRRAVELRLRLRVPAKVPPTVTHLREQVVI